MKHKKQIKEDVIKILNKNSVQVAKYIQNVEHMFNSCDNDDLLEDASLIWHAGTQVLEISWDYGSHTYFKIFVTAENISWKIQHGDHYYDNENNQDKGFFQIFQTWVDSIEQLHKQLTSRLESKKELFYELKGIISRHIASLVHGTDDGSIKFLGINRTNLRPMIVNKKDLDNYDVYNLDDYLACFDISYADKYWHLINEGPLFKLAEKYLQNNDSSTSYENFSIHEEKISLEHFKERFLLVFRVYLNEVDLDMHRRTKWLKVIKREPKYLGIKEGSCIPQIGVIESLDNCDVYDIDTFMNCFGIHEGRYVNKRKLDFREEMPYRLLVNKYYNCNPNLTQELKPIKTITETRLMSEDYIQMLYDELSDKYDSWGYNIRHGLGDKYVFIPKPLMRILKLKDKDLILKQDRLEERAKRILAKAKELKRKSDYVEASRLLEECVKMNTCSTKEAVDLLLVCYHKLKDFKKEKELAKYAFDIAPLDKYLEILRRDLTSNNSLDLKDYSLTMSHNLGQEYERELRKQPEYTFRELDDPRYELWLPNTPSERREEVEEKFEVLYNRIREIEMYFNTSIKNAQEHEKLGNLEVAVKIYERLVAEGCYKTSPYDRLIVIYSKQKRKNDLKRLLELSIDYFLSLEKRQWEYVQYLADKYDAHAYLKDELKRNGKVGSWYPFIYLYQPYPIIEKWRLRLSKI